MDLLCAAVGIKRISWYFYDIGSSLGLPTGNFAFWETNVMQALTVDLDL